ncbi:MAG: ShlB/FhaC/HecB family hemolysin secretion/activation protein [Burkholderiaceae bacterium]|nr:ShlB/FhaC/HecB family hemolysin secretion/activation protein [Burkholderiaceae bacterium]
MRGNPMDSMPTLQTPGDNQRVEPTVQPQAGDANAAVAPRLQQQIVPRYFDVQGNRVIALERIAPLLEPLAGRQMTVATLVGEVNKITALYQQEGYVLSFALLQNQDFANGVVRVTIVEGHVDALRINGEAGNAAGRLHTLSEPLLAENPLTRATLERALGLMRQVPGTRITPTLDMPKRAGGGTELVLDVSHTRVGVSAGIADMGTGMQGIVNLSTNSLTPLGEQIKLTAAIPTASGDVKYIAGSATVPLGSQGLAIEVDGYHYDAHPKDSVLQSQGWDRRVVNERLGLGLTYPLLLSNTSMVTASAGAYVGQSIDEYHREADNAWLQQRTHLRVLRAGLSVRNVTESQARELSINVYKGLDAMGAKKSMTSNYANLDAPGYDLDFTRFTADAKQTIQLPAKFGLTLSATGQYTRNALPSMEQTSFGAWRYGLGYPQGELAGDKGYGISAELNRKFTTGWPLLTSLQPYIMVDHARAWYNASNQVEHNGRKLSSAALGMRLTDDRYYVLDFNVAKPIGNLPLNRDDRRLRFNANYSLIYDGL